MAATYEEGKLQSLPIDDKGQANLGLRVSTAFYHPLAESAANPNLRVTLYDGATKLSSAAGVVVDTELPAAAALNGTWAKTTVAPIVGSPQMVNDGTNVVLVPQVPTTGGTSTAAGIPLGAQAMWVAAGDFRPMGMVANTLGDAATNTPFVPTLPLTGVIYTPVNNYGFNGSTWDRLRTRGTGILQVEQAYSFLYIASGQATTTVKSGAGTLRALNFLSAAVASATLIVYDNTAASGTVIASLLAVAMTGMLSMPFDAAFATGLTTITATANGPAMTVVYR